MVVLVERDGESTRKMVAFSWPCKMLLWHTTAQQRYGLFYFIYICVCVSVWYLCMHREKKRCDPSVCCQIELGQKPFYWHIHWCRRDALERLRWKGERKRGKERESGTLPSPNPRAPGGGAAGQGEGKEPWNAITERVWFVFVILPVSLSFSFPPQHLPSNLLSIYFTFGSQFNKKMSQSQFHHCYESFFKSRGPNPITISTLAIKVSSTVLPSHFNLSADKICNQI